GACRRLQRQGQGAAVAPGRLLAGLREPTLRRKRPARSEAKEMTTTANPLLHPWNGPFGLPPFAEVRAGHFEPAFDVAMREHLAEVDAIGGAASAPTFDITIGGLDRAGRLFDRVGGLFHNLASSETSPQLQGVERLMAPRLAAHDSRLYMNGPLFERIRSLHDRRADLALSGEQRRVLERYHTDFVRAGARLDAGAQARHARS